MAEPCLAARGVDKRFGGVHALRGVDFELGRDEVHALVGENGAGKSTLIKILSGLVAPDAGTIRLDGQPARNDSVKAAQALGIQTIHQELELALPLSVAENVFMAGCRCGMAASTSRRCIGKRRKRSRRSARPSIRARACAISR